MNERPTLLAKRHSIGRADVTLEGHLVDTARAARGILAPASRLRQRWLEFFGVPPSRNGTFDVTLEVACLLHDLGKANADFLAAVTGSGTLQTLRHEHISALILCLPEVRAWLRASPELDVDVLTAAVLSHHFKAADSKGEHGWCQPRGPKTVVRLMLDDDQVRRVLSEVGRVASLGPAPSLALSTWSASGPWPEAYRQGRSEGAAFQRALAKDRARRSLHLAVKTALIAADAASSALVREGHAIEAWLNDALHGESLTSEAIEAAVLTPRREAIERTGRPFRYHRFQDLAAAQAPRSLLLAACGAGKTLAAWRWLAATAKTHRFGSVIFLYPTRGTATEGFRDYVGWAPEAESALLHGTSRYELERIMENPPEALAGKQPGVSEADARLFALGLWPKRYFSATVDQFLSFLEHGYGGTCLLPRLADSAIVIDEVHSFDRRLFDNLVAFLRSFDVPVLCMTATLPSGRRNELVGAGLTVFPSEAHRADLADLEAAEGHPRYDLTLAPSSDMAFEQACVEARAGKRVLWVTNTVARCQERSRAFLRALGSLPITYHSRFRLGDRQQRHAETVQAFRSAAGAVAVTTQVCEMSLDLDADVLVTELAPASSLVQRFGRANRHGRPGDERRALVVVVEPPSPLPYEAEDLALARRFLAEVVGEGVSQRTLAEALERHERREARADGAARLLDSGYFAVPGSLRDIDEAGSPALLDSDIPTALERLRRRRPFDDLVVPAPRRLQHPRLPEHDALPHYLGVVSADRYDPMLGLFLEETR